MVYQNDLDPSLPDFADLLVQTERALSRPAGSAYEAEIRRTVLTVWTDALIALAADEAAAPPVRARAEAALPRLVAGLLREREDAEHAEWLSRRVARFLGRDYVEDEAPEPLTAPPGSPIGQ